MAFTSFTYYLVAFCSFRGDTTTDPFIIIYVANKLDSFSGNINALDIMVTEQKDGRIINMNHNITDSTPLIVPRELASSFNIFRFHQTIA